MGLGLGIPIGLRRHGVPRPTPLAIGGLWLWLRADLGVTLNGSDVAAWADQSGNGRNFAQVSGAKQPALVASGIGGKPSIRFTAANSDVLAATGFTGPTSAEVFLVVQHDNDPPLVGLGGVWDFGSNSTHCLVPYIDGKIYDSFGATARKDTAVDPIPSFTTPRVYSVRSEPGEWACYIDGVEQYITSTNTVGFRTTPTIGQGTPGGGTYHNGLIGELALFSPILSVGDRARLIAYFNTRYSTTAV